MSWFDAALMATFQHRMHSNQRTVFEDSNFIGQGVNLDEPPSGGVGHAVGVSPTLTMPSRDILRSSRRTDRNGASGKGRR